MSTIHPSETGGTGKSYPKFATDKPGAKVDTRISCAQCGFPFRPGTDVEGDVMDNPATQPVDLDVAVDNDQSKLPQHLQGLAAFAVSSKTISVPTEGLGCRLCGTQNPRGEHSREFDSFKDMSGR